MKESTSKRKFPLNFKIAFFEFQLAYSLYSTSFYSISANFIYSIHNYFPVPHVLFMFYFMFCFIISLI